MSEKELLLPKELLHKLYVEAFNELGLTKEELATLMGLGEYSLSARNAISGKLKGSKTKMPTKVDVGWIKMLVALKRTGVDVKNIKFSSKKNVILPKPKSKSPRKG